MVSVDKPRLFHASIRSFIFELSGSLSLYLSRNTESLSLWHIEQIDVISLFPLLVIVNFILFLSYFYDVTFNAMFKFWKEMLQYCDRDVLLDNQYYTTIQSY